MLLVDKFADVSIANGKLHNTSKKTTYKNITKEETPLWKLCMDITGSVFCLVVFSPIMLMIAIAIKITTGGPVIFKQIRVGHGGESFTMYKFNSMVVGAEAKKKLLMEFNERDLPAFKLKNDPRITPIGKFIRKWSLDEFPQFINVLNGEMSLVGPRPNIVEELNQYEDWHYGRLKIKPGITGLWQVTSRDRGSFDEWMKLDIKYCNTYSPLLDLNILFLTIPTVLSTKGAY